MTPMPPPFDRAAGLYRKAFNAQPEWAASAPGRVNLIGEHTDYNDGLVLPIALEQRTAVVLGPSPDGRWRLASEQQPATATFDPDDFAARSLRDWTSYIRGVVAGLDAAGHPAPPMQVAVASDVPVGGGLSSSAALEVATATALERALAVKLGEWEKILLCQGAEHEFAGVPCGFMDQAASVFGRAGHAMLLDCKARDITTVPIHSTRVALLVMNSMVRHDLASGEYARRRASCERAVSVLNAAGQVVQSLADVSDLSSLEVLKREPGGDELYRRAHHVVSEIERTAATARLLADGAFEEVGTRLNASHASLRDHYEVSCPELNLLVQHACEQPGVYGARMTGGGFGGCIVALVDAGRARAAGAAAARAYARSTGVSPDWFITHGGRGAHAEPAGG